MDRVKRIAQPSPVLIAVGPRDKENHASPDVMFKTKGSGDMKKKPKLRNNKNMNLIKNQINNFQKTEKIVTADDLTTTGRPGEAYWEQLSESRRVALDSALKENMQLQSKIMELEYENTKLKAMLAEATNSIQLLTEVLEENEAEDEDETQENDESESELDDSLVDASFTSV